MARPILGDFLARRRAVEEEVREARGGGTGARAVRGPAASTPRAPCCVGVLARITGYHPGGRTVMNELAPTNDAAVDTSGAAAVARKLAEEFRSVVAYHK